MSLAVRQWGKWVIGLFVLAYFTAGVVFAQDVSKESSKTKRAERAPAQSQVQLGIQGSSWFAPSWQRAPQALKFPAQQERRLEPLDQPQSVSPAFKKRTELKGN